MYTGALNAGPTEAPKRHEMVSIKISCLHMATLLHRDFQLTAALVPARSMITADLTFTLVI